MLFLDLISFLCNYYGIVNESLKFNRLTHADIKILFPFVKRSSYEKVENENLVKAPQKSLLFWERKNNEAYEFLHFRAKRI